MLRRRPRVINGIARILDLSFIGVAFAYAVWWNFIRTERWIPATATNTVSERNIQYLFFLTVVLLTWAALSHLMGVYSSHRTEALSSSLGRQLRTQALWMVVTGFLIFLIRFSLLRRGFLGSFFVYASVLLTFRETCFVVLLQELHRQGYNLRRIGIIGGSASAERFTAFVEQNPEVGYRVVEVESEQNLTAAVAGKMMPELDDIFILAGGTPAEELEPLALQLLHRGKRVHIVPGMFNARLFRQELEDFAGIPVLSIGGPGLNALQAAFKRTIDVIGSTLLLVLLSPLLALVVLAIKVSSSGPILFVQERLGQGAQRFPLYKFRTMVSNAEDLLRTDPALYKKYVDNNFKLPKKEDVRITALGRFLRTTSLNELPQLFNVFKGDMSLVGPRPIVPAEIEQYGDYADLFLSVKPGLTGKWQINGRSEIKDYGVRAAMDLEYIRDQSLSTDVAILVKTIRVVLQRRGAY